MAAPTIEPVIPARERLEHLVAGFGNNRIARLLRVSASTSSRWRSGHDRISPANERRLVDLDYLLTRLLQVLPKDVAEIWLTSYNAHLGAVPLDVVETRGALPVVAAIEVEAQEAYA